MGMTRIFDIFLSPSSATRASSPATGCARGVKSGGKAAVYLTFVTTCGLVHNMYWNDVQSEVPLDDLFAF